MVNVRPHRIVAFVEFTKHERKQLRELASDIYETELGALLETVASSGDQWRGGALLASEMSDAIHQFHQGESRRHWTMYQSLSEDQIVARGIALGLIGDGKLPHALKEKLSHLLALFQSR